MTSSLRILRPPQRPPDAVLEALRLLPVANVSDSMENPCRGGGNLRPFHNGAQLCGVALTVRSRPADNLLIHKALDLAGPGDVLVIDAGGDVSTAVFGEIMLAYGLRRGIAGIVIDGAIRDAALIAKTPLPVFARGVSHRGPFKDGFGEINAHVVVDGMAVAPGDIIVGDPDGVLAIPCGDAPQVVARAKACAAKESETLRSIADGTIDRGWVDIALKARGWQGDPD